MGNSIPYSCPLDVSSSSSCYTQKCEQTLPHLNLGTPLLLAPVLSLYWMGTWRLPSHLYSINFSSLLTRSHQGSYLASQSVCSWAGSLTLLRFFRSCIPGWLALRLVSVSQMPWSCVKQPQHWGLKGGGPIFILGRSKYQPPCWRNSLPSAQRADRYMAREVALSTTLRFGTIKLPRYSQLMTSALSIHVQGCSPLPQPAACSSQLGSVPLYKCWVVSQPGTFGKRNSGFPNGGCSQSPKVAQF